ncbi:MAG: winged helix-turn-helix transcriptional regulator [Hadesarchaea archaeon]|nr:winged helix-turn-helix transcriptional regulator [Hadesarchaea archaeon]
MQDKSLHQLRSKIPPDYNISADVLEKVRKAIEDETKKTLKFLRAISHPTRLRILRALRINELCVCVLVYLMRMKYSKLSYHLKILKDAGLVEFRKDRNFLIYKITDLGKKVLKDIEG